MGNGLKWIFNEYEFDNRVNKKEKVKVLSNINLDINEGEIGIKGIINSLEFTD